MSERAAGLRRRRRGPKNDRDAGSASLWALSMAMVLWACVAAVVLAGVAVTARHRAATAADMAALAAASVIARNDPGGGAADDLASGAEGCAAASAIAVANDAIVINCQVNGRVVDVTTSVATPALGLLHSLGLNAVSARARAGPG
jgi:secretion/DNA translocation related TadE-like protein